MATLPGAFFGEHAAGADLSFLLANVKPGAAFENVFLGSQAEGSGKDDIFNIEAGDNAPGGRGYDAVVQSPENGLLGDLKLDNSTEAGILTGDLDADIFGNQKDNNLVGNAGDNVLRGRAGDDALIGNDGDDRLVGGAGRDTLSGGEGNDTLDGGAGRDQLFGMAGDDELFGAAGRDTLIGGPGNDTLFGGHGRDTLVGDEGADVFGFLKGEKGMDTIADFEATVDKIDLTDFNTDFDSLKFKNSGDDVIVTVGSGKNAVKFKLLGYQADDINGGFFQF